MYCVHIGYLTLSYCNLKNLHETITKHYVTTVISFLVIFIFPLVLDCYSSVQVQCFLDRRPTSFRGVALEEARYKVAIFVWSRS
jgi:hypothetical protein